MGASLALTTAALLAFAPPLELGSSAPAGQSKPEEPRGSPQQPGKAPPRGPPPPERVGGLSGFESLSTLVYAAAPDRPHQLRATYVFPERVRWLLSAKDEKTTERSLHYRFGETVYRIPPRKAESQECEGEDRAEILLQMELRQALMLYPDGFAWKGGGLERRVEVGKLGSLHAHLATAADKMPCEIGDADAAGNAVDAFKAISWREVGGRLWPGSIELWHAGELVWKETVDSVDTAGRFVDFYFVPPDRRDKTAREPMAGEVRDLEIPESCALRIELAAGMSWDAALEELLKHRVAWSPRLAEQKLDLDRNATFEVSQEGQPTACLLRLSSVPAKPPPGFAAVRPRKGLACAIRGLAEATAAQISELARALPPGALRERAYLRFDPRDAKDGHVLVVLPYSLGR
jgi:hypothetical protein